MNSFRKLCGLLPTSMGIPAGLCIHKFPRTLPVWMAYDAWFVSFWSLLKKEAAHLVTPLSWSTSGWKATSIATNYIKFSSFLWAFTWYHSWKEVCGSKSYIFKNLMNYFLQLLSALIGGKFIFTKKSFTRFSLVKDFFVKIDFPPIRALNSFKK